MEKLTEYRKLNASVTTVTQNVSELSGATGNIYKTTVVIAKRADQVAQELKDELSEKLKSFAFYSDSPEREVFENEEQIELSMQYEELPKPTMLALQEFVTGRVMLVEPEVPVDELGLPTSPDKE